MARKIELKKVLTLGPNWTGWHGDDGGLITGEGRNCCLAEGMLQAGFSVEDLKNYPGPSHVGGHEALIELDEKQCLSEKQQLEIARAYYGNGQSPQAAAAFELFVQVYPNSTEAGDLRLLLGIIYARDLEQYEAADQHLTFSLKLLRDPARLGQCKQWIRRVRDELGKPISEF